jgi:hypothetical protein
VIFIDIPILRGDYLRFEIKLRKPTGWLPAKANGTNRKCEERKELA